MTILTNMDEGERLFMCEDENCPVERKGCKVIQNKDLSKPMFCIHSKLYQCDFQEMNWINIGNVTLLSHDSKVNSVVKGNYLYLTMEFKNEGDNEGSI